MQKQKIGFIGLGRMGAPMSRRLLAAGYELVVLDVNDVAMDALVEAGAEKAASPRDVADRTDIVITSLPKPDIVRHMALGEDGIAAGSRATIMLDVSTTGPSAAKEVAEGLSKVGKQWVDCPVSGGIKGATEGTLALMVSCPNATFETVKPVIANFGKAFHVGEEAGLGQVVKLANNMLAAAAVFLTGEAMAMGVKAGVDAKVMLDIINMSSGRNSASQDKFPKAVLPGTFDFGFATGLSYKDVRLCVDESETLGVPMVGGALVRQILAITQSKYGADSDFTSMVKLIEDWSGVEIRG
ncbi:NAD(P)-dependent oxidoreductase [Roseibium marinum]|uniref:3-hydroxyisobutyrate dehydrogenase-like beta-hydroxyacid dehydrogenase n=1 Tax=Roseibium marinum TaxID=281252 RepID=A0A2S3UN57_9HYPH|nr:NAD(P)-dependent oxidoreductase [Roseibium marinum]POF29121.1 3-hydroxyisobutyrate dehydrogenase-like beta-hydroxyacid dehydrogenase [Roseibium marinum]